MDGKPIRNPRTAEKPTAPRDPLRSKRFCVIGPDDAFVRRGPDDVKIDLENAMVGAIRAGVTTCVLSVRMGPQVWAGEIFLRLMRDNPSLRLIVAAPWPGCADGYPENWKAYTFGLMARAEYVKFFRPCPAPDTEYACHVWMLRHSGRVIAVDNRKDPVVRRTLAVAREMLLPVTTICV